MTRSLTFFLAAFWLALSSFAFAQDARLEKEERTPSYVVTTSGAPDYAAWDRVAERVEGAVEVGRASDQVLADLRQELSDWRDLFADAQAENSIRINTLKTQLSTLGPEPETAGSEPAVLTQRRSELTNKLNSAQLPVQEAEEAFSRADVLIREIDSLVRARQADQILKLGPSPVNPAIWPQAFLDLKTSLDLAVNEVRKAWGSDAQRADLNADLPLTLLLLIIAFVLIFFSRVWIIRLGSRVRNQRSGPSRGVVGFAMSLGQVVAPLIGIFALIKALNLAGVLGLRGQVIVDALPWFGFLLVGGLWIGTRLFSAETSGGSLIELPRVAQRAEARVNVALLGLLLGVWVVLSRLAKNENYSDGTLAVLVFPILVGSGYLLVRIGRLLRRHADEQTGTEGKTFLERIVVLIGRSCELVGIASPVLAAIGYTSLAVSTMFPTVTTMGIIAVLALLHVFLTNLYGVVRKLSEEEAGQALLPVLMTTVLVLLSLPLLALVWGARPTDLTELWTTFLQGFQLGEARVTPRTFVVFALIFGVGYAATRATQSALKASILPKTKLDKGGQNAISVGVGYVGIFLAAVIAITSAGIDLSSIAIIAGALSVGIGFGLQTIVSNFVSGIILLIERPISEGDWIEVGGQMGYVRDISVRATRIETFDRTDVILPNSDLVSGVVTNYTRGNSIGRVIVPVGVAYGSDTRRIEEILREIAENHPMVTVNPPPNVVFQGFGADSLDFEIRAILSDVNYMLTVKSEINHEIARRFVEEGIEIPYAQRDIWLRNPEVLTAAAAAPLAAPTAPAAPPATTNEPPAVSALTVEDMHESDDGDGDD